MVQAITKFKANQEMRYNEDPLDKTTFLFGERKINKKGKTTLMRVTRLCDANGATPPIDEHRQIHKIKVMKMVNPNDRSDFIMMEYIDTFDGYTILGADMLRNALWSEDDEKIYRRIRGLIPEGTDYTTTTSIRPHPHTFSMEIDDIDDYIDSLSNKPIKP